MPRYSKKSKGRSEKAPKVSRLPRDENGNIKAGPGRPKGALNKVNQEAKHAIAMAFENLGGIDGLTKWARASKTNKTLFYTQIYTKLIPVVVAGKLDVGGQGAIANRNAEELERLLLGIIADRRDGSAQAGVVIDADPIRDVTPQLVLSSPRGTKAA